jgi:demethylmenaquinone methyltransferase/2-methoxy-6-polyprenyl-1,4-benzoquinol methylase
MRRVAMPGGLVVTLDITRPRVPGWDRIFGFYFRRIVPLIGALAGDRDAYSYLPASVKRFPSPEELAAAMAWLCSPEAGAVNGQRIPVVGRG